MKKSYYFLLLIQLLVLNNLHGQDTTKVLTVKEFFTLILQNNPIVQQAELLDDRAKQELRIAKGLLDPTLNSRYDDKQFQNKEYFTSWDSYLRIPTWYGLDFKAGYERNTGAFVNPENYTPNSGLAYLGISVPIGQGLLIDERRVQIKQARQFSTIAEAERIKILNKLLLQAGKDYWDWMYHYTKLTLYTEGLELANTRYDAVSERVNQGDLPAIDTVEAIMQVQNFQLLLAQAQLEYTNASLIVSNYLWSTEGAPVEVTEQVIPSETGTETTPLQLETVERLTATAMVNHPDLVQLNSKLIQLDIEKRFIADKFKPRVNVNYNLLQSSFFSEDIYSSAYLSNNYKFGLSFSYPLFLRSERGKYQMTKLKIQETGYDLVQTNRDIEINIQQSANDWIALENQIQIQQNLVNNADALRIGELTRFENGESSIFLINARENSVISNRVKLYELKAKYAKSKVMLQWAAGAIQF